MHDRKSLAERQTELQALMASLDGRKELEKLASCYQTAGGKARPMKTSVITYIIVHERLQGLIAD